MDLTDDTTEPTRGQVILAFTTLGQCLWHRYDPSEDFDYELDEIPRGARVLIESEPPGQHRPLPNVGDEVYVLDEDGNSQRFGHGSASDDNIRPQCHNIFLVMNYTKSLNKYLCAMPRRPEEFLWGSPEFLFAVIAKPGDVIKVSVDEEVWAHGLVVEIQACWIQQWTMLYQIYDPALNRISVLSQEIPH